MLGAASFALPGPNEIGAAGSSLIFFWSFLGDEADAGAEGLFDDEDVRAGTGEAGRRDDDDDGVALPGNPCPGRKCNRMHQNATNILSV